MGESEMVAAVKAAARAELLADHIRQIPCGGVEWERAQVAAICARREVQAPLFAAARAAAPDRINICSVGGAMSALRDHGGEEVARACDLYERAWALISARRG